MKKETMISDNDRAKGMLRLSIVWRKREYRSFGTSLFFIGIALSSSNPFITLFLVQRLHVNVSLVSLFFLTAIVGPMISIPVGRFSDRASSRLPLIRFSAIWLAIGWGLLAFTTQFWLTISIGVIFFCFNSILSAQIFASVRDIMTTETETYEGTVNSTIRTAYSLGWIIGPVIGSWIVTIVGLQATFFVTSFFYLVSTLPLLSLRIKNTFSREEVVNTTKQSKRGWKDVRLFCFALLCMLIMSGDTIKSSYLPLYIVEDLKQQPFIFGTLLSVSAIFELVVIPIAGILADKIGTGTVIAAGVAIGIIDYVLLAVNTSVWQLYIVQLLHVGVLAAMLGLGVTYAQQLNNNQEPGFASSTFLGALGLSSPLGSVIGSYGVQLLGLPKVFFIPSVICCLSLVFFLIVYYQDMASKRVF